MKGSKLKRDLKPLTVRDFKDDEGIFTYEGNTHDIVFYEQFGSWARMIIQVWYKEGEKKYKREEKVLDRRFGSDKWEVRESNRKVWYWINKFRDIYCND
jgi:hypothetical protein